MRLIITLLSLLPLSVFGQQPYPGANERPPTMEEMLSVKETFRYEIKFGFFKLGRVDVTLQSDTLYNGSMHKHLLAIIRTNSKLPLVGTEHNEYNSLFTLNDSGYPVTSLYWKDDVDENLSHEIVYKFERDSGFVTYKEEDNTRDTLSLVEPATAGEVIFYFSRLFAGSDSTFRLPVYVTRKLGYIIGKNSKEVEFRNYPAFDKPILAYKLEGSTEDIDGPFNFSGDFRAWFLADDLRVPLEARVRVFIGNVMVKLVEYKREEL